MRIDELEEAEVKKAVFTFGRLNPPHYGHHALIQTLQKTAEKQGCDWFLFVSSKTGDEKNPLTYEQKVWWIQALFPETKGHLVIDPSIKTPLVAATWLYKKGYHAATFVAGEDDMASYGEMIKSGNAHGQKNPDAVRAGKGFIFNPLDFAVSPRLASATNARKNVTDGDPEAFVRSILGPKISPHLAKLVHDQLYPTLRKTMGLGESVSESEQLNKHTPSVRDLAKKYTTDPATVHHQINRGVKVEFEHTNDIELATEIAMDHLGERLDYYDLLDKLEKAPKKKFGENNLEVIDEVADQPYRFLLAKSNPTASSYIFQTDNNTRMTVNINTDPENLVADIGFYDATDKDNPTVAVTGKGDAFRVFATVGAIVKQFVNKRKPTYISFSGKASEAGRIKLYDMIAKNIGRYLPEYKLVNSGDIMAAGDKGYVFKRVAQENVGEAKYNYSLDDYKAVPYDKGVDTPDDTDSEPHIGPQEGKYLNLMLKGMKPATIIFDEPGYKELFAPYIKSGQIVVAGKYKNEIYLTLPGEEWRGRKLQEIAKESEQLYDRLKAGVRINWDIDEYEKKRDAQVGMLLGIPKESVKYFLKTRYNESVVEAKKPKKPKTIIDGALKTLVAKGRSEDEAIADLKKEIDSKFYELDESLDETLKQVKGKWALVSRHNPKKVLQYYHGSGHPSKEWVSKVERRVHSFEAVEKDKYTEQHGDILVKVSYELDDEPDGFGGFCTVRLYKENKQIGEAIFTKHKKGFWFAEDVSIEPEYRRQGLATLIYDVAKKKLGRIVRSTEQTDMGKAFWGNKQVWEDYRDAARYAAQAHAGQKRSGGKPYISHPVRVANLVRKYKDSEALDKLMSAAFLHDTIEDTDTTEEQLRKMFGDLVASLVKELTSDKAEIEKLGKAEYLTQKMIHMSSWGLVIKLADRLDNVTDIKTAKSAAWRQRYKAETESILDQLERNRKLSGTHQNIIADIRAKLAELNESWINEAEEIIKPRVYLDMDGVLADFFGEWSRISNVDHYKDIDDVEAKLQLVRDHPTFWIDLPMLPHAKALIKAVVEKYGEYRICSKPLEGDTRSKPGKMEWIKKHLSDMPPAEVVLTADKAKFATHDGAPNILVDDYGVNINSWRAAGGIGIKYEDSAFPQVAKILTSSAKSGVSK